MPEATMERPGYLSVEQEITPEEAALLEPMEKWHATHQIGKVPVMRVVEPNPDPLFKNRVKVCFYDEFGRRVYTSRGRSAMPLDVETVLLSMKTVAAALYAALGAHGGLGHVVDVNYNEGSYLSRDAHGNYIVACRVWDYKKQGHTKYLLRVPSEMEFELVDAREVSEV